MRLDKWLVCARFVKTRSLAQKIFRNGKLRINQKPVTKSHFQVEVGQILDFEYAQTYHHIEILGLAEKRGSATEAQKLYRVISQEKLSISAQDQKELDAYHGQQDLGEMAQSVHFAQARRAREQLYAANPVARREQGSGRPTKNERRALQKLKSQ